MLTKNEVFFLFTIISSYVFGMYLNPPIPFTKKDILRSIDQIAASSASSPGDKQVIIGFNTNLDAVVNNGASFVSSFVGKPIMDKIPSVTSNEIDIAQREDLAHVFAHHLKTSSAGERSIVSDGLWTDLLRYLEQNEELAEIKVGGNAALMAEAMARSGDNIKVSLLGVSGPKVLGRLHSNVISVTGTPKVTILNEYFNTRVDEVHLILEYAANTRFGPFTSQRANRFIVSRDFTNGVLGAAELLNSTANAAADLVVLSGIHLMESLLPSLQAKEERIRQVNLLVASAVHPETKIHLEFASTSDAMFTKAIVQQIKYESMGMNEEEFYAICHSLGLCVEANDAVLLSKTHTPNVKRLQQVIQEMFRVMPTLNRLHYHSYSYHLIVQRRQAGERWPNAKQAVAAGSLKATLRACLVSQVADLHGNQLLLSVSAFKTASGEVKEFTKQDPVVHFETEGELDFYIVPVVACAVPKQTVGLGDNISAQALTKQL